MVVGILQVELQIDWSQSLKDKRRVVSSIKDRLHREHMVSVAEVGSLEDWHLATLGIVLAATDVAYCQSVMDKVLQKLTTQRDCVLSDHSLQILTGQ